MQRLQREAAVAARLAHEGIIRIHQIGSDAGVHYIAMDLIDGPTLREALPGMPLPRRILALEQLARYCGTNSGGDLSPRPPGPLLRNQLGR